MLRIEFCHFNLTVYKGLLGFAIKIKGGNMLQFGCCENNRTNIFIFIM